MHPMAQTKNTHTDGLGNSISESVQPVKILLGLTYFRRLILSVKMFAITKMTRNTLVAVPGSF